MQKNIRLIVNIFIFVSAIAVVIYNFFQPYGYRQFRYFTIQSNVFLAIMSLLNVIFYKRDYKIIYKLTFFANIFTTITFLTVVFYLAPISKSYFSMFKGINFFMHFTNPLLGVLSLLLIKREIKYMEIYLGTLFMIYYGFLYFICVFTKVWPDFYSFTNNLNAIFIVISVLIFMALYAGVANLLYYLGGIINERKN